MHGNYHLVIASPTLVVLRPIKQMDPGEKAGWTQIVSAEDLDRHMADNGQAEAIANIFFKMFQSVPVAKDSLLLFAGAGTGQIFDYISPEKFFDFNLLFSDLSNQFLLALQKRLKSFPSLRWKWVQDDIENTVLSQTLDGVFVSMVLQHVEWEKAIHSIARLQPNKIYIIEQRNDRGGHAVTKSRDLAPSIKKFSEVANPTLVTESKLTEKLKELGFVKSLYLERSVQDDKTLFGLTYKHI